MAEGDYDAALKALDEAGGSPPDPQAPVTDPLFPGLPEPERRPRAMALAEMIAEQIIMRYDQFGTDARLATRPVMTAVIRILLDDGVIAVPDPDARALTDYAVCWGSEDPNDCGGPIPGPAGMLTYDDEDEARGMTQYIGGSYVARREVTRGRWERVDEGKPDEAAPARSRHGQMAAEQPPVDTRTRVRPPEALSGDPGAAEGHSL